MSIEEGQRVRLPDGREGVVVNRQSALFVACIELDDGTFWEETHSRLAVVGQMSNVRVTNIDPDDK